jgi:NADH-quinone oxidoreductase subunit L
MRAVSVVNHAITLAVLAPLALVVAFGLVRFVTRRLSERVTAALAGLVFFTSAAATVVAAVALVVSGRSSVEVSLWKWFEVSADAFSLTLVVDALGLAFGALGATLVGLVARFSATYLHRERGYFRFFFLLSLMGAGVMLVSFAGGLELVIFGWELVGIASALLIAFFHDRPAAVRHGFQAFATYRVCDFGIIAALTWLHHTTGTASLTEASAAPWRVLGVPSTLLDAHLIALGLLLAAMAKSAQFPVSGWLPRAMEGPTPSSAIFYGALSIHLGPVLLLRASSLFAAAPLASLALVVVGALTAIYATFVGRVQADAKGALAYASMAQVGLIFVEIGLGWHTLALVHVLGHATLRAYELLRAPSVIRDVHERRKFARRKNAIVRWFDSTELGRRIYRFGLERGYVEPLLVEVMRRVVTLLREIDRRDADFVERLEREPRPTAAQEAQ